MRPRSVVLNDVPRGTGDLFQWNFVVGLMKTGSPQLRTWCHFPTRRTSHLGDHAPSPGPVSLPKQHGRRHAFTRAPPATKVANSSEEKPDFQTNVPEVMVREPGTTAYRRALIVDFADATICHNHPSIPVPLLEPNSVPGPIRCRVALFRARTRCCS